MADNETTKNPNEISAKTKEHPESVTVTYEVPSDLAGLNAKFGEAAVVSAARGAIIISLQSFVRSHIDKPVDEIQSLVSAWLPGVRQASVKQTPLEKAAGALKQMSAEDRAALLAQLKALQKG